MTTYVDVFGGEAVPPSQNRFAEVSLTANTTFFWPELASGANLMADIMEVTASAAYDLTLPEANVVSTGRDILFRNVGANTVTIKGSAGATIGTLAAGEVKLIYLTDNTTPAGEWAIFTFGTGTSAADASALAGYGLEVVGGLLAQDATTETSAGSVSVTSDDRAKVLISSNSGAVTYSLLAASSAGDGYFFSVSNQGTGVATINPNSTETVDGEATKDINPGESATFICDGFNWVSVGYGRSTVFQFTKLVLDITSGGPFTLTSVQAQNKLIQFIGVAPAAVTVNIPAVVAVYYLQGSFTGGFNLTIKTAAGSGITMSGTDRTIAYCDGVDVVLAQTSAVPATDLAGGVAGAVVFQSGVNNTDFTAAGVAGELFESAGTGTPVWKNVGLVINSLTDKTTPADADEIPLSDSAAADVGKKLTWANVKSVLKTYFDTLYSTITLAGNNTWTGTQTFRDNKFEVTDDSDTSKKVVLQASGITTATTRTLTIPDANLTLAGTDAAQNWTASQRSAPITDNDGSFDLSGAGNNYTSTPTSAVAITFTNIASNAGKSGYLTLINGSNYAYTAHANTKITTADLAKIVASGTYVLPYLCDGTDVFILGVWTKP